MDILFLIGSIAIGFAIGGPVGVVLAVALFMLVAWKRSGDGGEDEFRGGGGQ